VRARLERHLRSALAWRLSRALGFCAATACASLANANASSTPATPKPAVTRAAPLSDAAAETPLALGTYAHLFGALELGRGLRFNNPYRLETVIGDEPESLSLTATYLDFSAGAAFGAPDGIQHGAAAHLSVALHGIPQEVATPSYVALKRMAPALLAHVRGGFPIVLEPDLNLGFELALGGAWLVWAGIGLGAELTGSLFYGAATHEQPGASVIPIVGLQLGVFVDYEILP
jgi:hypothetical protein